VGGVDGVSRPHPLRLNAEWALLRTAPACVGALSVRIAGRVASCAVFSDDIMLCLGPRRLGLAAGQTRRGDAGCEV